MLPTVTVITPTTADRVFFNDRISQIFHNQDYPYKQHIVIYDTHPQCRYSLKAKNTIGQKLNIGSREAHGTIILRMDSDDLYAPDWITRSVQALLSSRAECVGLSSIYYHHQAAGQYLHWQSDPRKQQFICGATMCYYRDSWLKHPFADTSHGEDGLFQQGLACASHDYNMGFLATLHGGNTESHKAIPLMKKVPQNEVLKLNEIFR